MTEPIRYGPVDEAVKEWIKTGGTETNIQAAGNVFLAMPKSSPRPALLITMVGGGPVRRADLPLSQYRLSFDCIAVSRSGASAIARALAADLDLLGRNGPGFVAAGVYLGGADLVGIRWQPDPDSDVPRYIVDALITTVQ